MVAPATNSTVWRVEMTSACADQHNIVMGGHGQEDVSMFDEADGNSCFYPSDFSFPSPDHTGWLPRTNVSAGHGHGPHPAGLDDDFAGIDAFLSKTDESRMDDALFAGETPHMHEDQDFDASSGISFSAASDHVDTELPPFEAKIEPLTERPSLPSSASSTSLVTKVDEQQDWKDASPNIISASCCDCGDPNCTEPGIREPAPILSRSSSRKMSRFATEPSSRMHSSLQSVSSDKSGTTHSEVFSTITQQSNSTFNETSQQDGEEIWRRKGVDSEFQLDLEETVASLPESDHYFYLDNSEVLGNAPRPLSPGPTSQVLRSLRHTDGALQYQPYSSGRQPYSNRSNVLHKTYSVDGDLYRYSNRQSPPEASGGIFQSVKREYQHAWSNHNQLDGLKPAGVGNSRSLPKPTAAAAAGSMILSPQPKQATLRHSLSESALHSGPRWGPQSTSYPDGAGLPEATVYGPGYGSSSAIASGSQHSPSSLLAGSISAKLYKTGSSTSASSHVRAQIQSYTQSKMSQQRDEQEQLQPSSNGRIITTTTSPAVKGSTNPASKSQVSAFALISRVAAGINIPGMCPASEPTRTAELSLATSVGMSFSKLNSLPSPANGHGTGEQVEEGLKLVQILVSCAEAVACRDSRQASSLLQTLKQLASPHGDVMQRVAACFMEGLWVRIYSTPAGFKTAGSSNGSSTTIPAALPKGSSRAGGKSGPTDRDRQDAFKLMCQSCPYVGFGHYSANTAILEAFAGEDNLHIIDLGMAHGLQWPGLISGLASRAGGKPKSLRITGVGLNADKLAQAGEQLERAAMDAGVTFSFKPVTHSLENVTEADLGLRDGEALAVNSVLQLHCVVKESRGSLNSVLQKIRLLDPKILTLVEQDASHNGPFFMGRFVEALHYYSAIFDSLDAVLPRYSTQRVKIEQFHFAEEIRNIVACEGPARVERHEKIDQWRRRMSRAGFQPLPLKFISQARRWLTTYDCPGYSLADEKGCLVLSWNTKPIIAASSWRC